MSSSEPHDHSSAEAVKRRQILKKYLNERCETLGLEQISDAVVTILETIGARVNNFSTLIDDKLLKSKLQDHATEQEVLSQVIKSLDIPACHTAEELYHHLKLHFPSEPKLLATDAWCRAVIHPSWKGILGSGGEAVVFTAEIHGRNEYVAAKSCKSYKAAVDECTRYIPLDHRNIVQFLGFSAYQEDARKTPSVCILLELGSSDLAERLRQSKSTNPARQKPLHVAESLDIAIGVAKGIEYLHTKHSLVHCDIKAENIIFVHGVWKLCDFGSAKPIGWTPLYKVFTTHNNAPDEYRDAQKTQKSDEPVQPSMDVFMFGNVIAILAALDQENTKSLTLLAKRCCTQSTERPTMSDVVSELQKIQAFASSSSLQGLAAIQIGVDFDTNNKKKNKDDDDDD